MLDINQLHAHAERIRASGVLGRSRLMRRLFDFLVECSLTDRAPKEIEVAIDVFDKDAGFDVSQDAMVRVYIHKLRRKLEEFYAGPGRLETERLVISKGAYRFVIEPVPPEATEEAQATEPALSPPLRSWRSRWIAVALATSLAVNAAALAWLGLGKLRAAPDSLAEVRANPVWARVLGDDRTIFLVLGDSYLFGQTDASHKLTRLVRDFSINSPSDLEQYLKLHPNETGEDLDLQLSYLPTAAGFALRDVMPVLAPAHRRVRVALASELNPALLTSAHIVYIGYLSGMGMLRDLVFAGSRFALGSSDAELVDRTTGKRYLSQAAMPNGEEKYHDYGYFATFTGPTGNQIIVISGTRDVALMHTAEAVTQPRALAALTASAHGTNAFEALYDVYGMDRMNLDGKLVLTSKLNTSRIWTGESVEAAPVGAAQPPRLAPPAARGARAAAR